MKKYQLWLERKSYSQHLLNLMKIKHSNRPSNQKIEHHASRSVNPVQTPSRDQITYSRYKQMEDFHADAEKLGDISYSITFKELKNRKVRLMKTFEIMNENMSMARRLKQVKSVFSNTFKDKTNSDHSNKRKLFEKKCQTSNQQLREQNFKKFMRWKNNKAKIMHRFQFTISVDSISKLLHSQSEYAAIWCQISTQKGFVRSDFVNIQQFHCHKFIFRLDQEVTQDCLFRLYVCKGLQSSLIGKFQFRRTDLGKSLTSSHRSDDGQLEITLTQRYERAKRQKPVINMK